MENLAEVIAENKYAGVALGLYTSDSQAMVLVEKSTSKYNGAEFLAAQGGTSSTVPVPFIAGSTVPKNRFVSIYADAEGATSYVFSYICGGSGSANSFPNLKRFELDGLSDTGIFLCALATALTEVVLHEGLQKIGTGSFKSCVSLTELKLPDSLTSVGGGFCQTCNKLQELYIPSSATPPTDDDSLSVTTVNAPAYINGIVLKGPGAAAWKEALPDRDVSPYYRKLILDPEWA